MQTKMEMENTLQAFEDKLTLSKTISEMLMPIIEERKEDDEDEELLKTITDEIIKRRDKINEIKQIKEKKILVILGQMYNGVIISQQLSCRRGQFYRYRCQYALGLDSVKQTLLQNLHAVSEKITVSKNLDILEYVLEKYGSEDNSSITHSYSYTDSDRKKGFNFDEITIIEKKTRYTEYNNFEIIQIDEVCVFDNGNISFYHNQGRDNKEKKNLQTKNFNMLYLKFKDEINKLAKGFIEELDDEIKERTDELEEIKLKGSHLLMSAELQKDSDD